jgi:hypothetical protein
MSFSLQVRVEVALDPGTLFSNAARCAEQVSTALGRRRFAGLTEQMAASGDTRVQAADHAPHR